MMYIFECVLDDTDIIKLNNITNIKNAHILFAGLFLYASDNCIDLCSKIENILDSDTIRINKNALKTGTFDIIFTDNTPVKYQELCESLKDVQEVVNSNGRFVRINFRNEDNIERDKLNGIKTRDKNLLTLKAFPVEFNPSVDRLEKAGFFEQHNCIIWLARKDFIDSNKNYSDIDELRDTVLIGEETYRIKEKNKVGQIGNDYLYYTLGLNKI